MDPRYVLLYLSAMRDEATSAALAYSRIQERVGELAELRERTADLFREGATEDEMLLIGLGSEDFLAIDEVEEEIAAAIEAFLSAQARLSLFLSPSPAARVPARTRQRAEVLRHRLALSETDDLGDRGLRNAWMHIDESIDAYVFERAAAPDLIGRHVGRVEKDRQKILRLIDPSGLLVWLLGEEYSLREMSDWLDDIERRLAIALQRAEDEVARL